MKIIKKYKITINYKNLTNISFDVESQLNKLQTFYKKLLKNNKILTVNYLKGSVIVNTNEIKDIQIEEIKGED